MKEQVAIIFRVKRVKADAYSHVQSYEIEPIVRKDADDRSREEAEKPHARTANH